MGNVKITRPATSHVPKTRFVSFTSPKILQIRANMGDLSKRGRLFDLLWVRCGYLQGSELQQASNVYVSVTEKLKESFTSSPFLVTFPHNLGHLRGTWGCSPRSSSFSSLRESFLSLRSCLSISSLILWFSLSSADTQHPAMVRPLRPSPPAVRTHVTRVQDHRGQTPQSIFHSSNKMKKKTPKKFDKWDFDCLIDETINGGGSKR